VRFEVSEECEEEGRGGGVREREDALEGGREALDVGDRVSDGLLGLARALLLGRRLDDLLVLDLDGVAGDDLARGPDGVGGRVVQVGHWRRRQGRQGRRRRAAAIASSEGGAGGGRGGARGARRDDGGGRHGRGRVLDGVGERSHHAQVEQGER